LFNNIRYAPEVLQLACSQFVKCDLTPLPETDEVYISHYNMDAGGDQGLFDRHYDGNMRAIPYGAVVRALVYVNADDSYQVVFNDSQVTKNFKTYEFGILDFHREYHWVLGAYSASDEPRIVLKLNYMICPDCSAWYKHVYHSLHNTVFFIVKASMEYSKSPKTPVQRVIGFFCNAFREINNVEPSLTFVAFFVLLGVVLVPSGLALRALCRFLLVALSATSGCGALSVEKATAGDGCAAKAMGAKAKLA